MDRLQQKNELQFELGILFGPLLRIVERPSEYDEQDRSEAMARYCFDFPKYLAKAAQFCHSQDGYIYSVEEIRITRALHGVMGEMSQPNSDVTVAVPKGVKEARSALDAIPVPRSSIILEAGSPFTAYCKIRELCETEATKDLAVVDAYMDDSIFHRFLRYVRPDAPVTLVTSDLRSAAGKKDQQRHAEFLDVSRLFSQERDPAHYRLVLQPASVLHDRWMRFDNKRLISLGGSSKDAGDRQHFTVTNLDATPTNLQAFQNHIDTGTEYYGPSTPTHK